MSIINQWEIISHIKAVLELLEVARVMILKSCSGHFKMKLLYIAMKTFHYSGTLTASQYRVTILF